MSFFSQNIRFLRNTHQMSQSAFAELFGLKRTAVGAYEEERAEPKVELFVKIARHFGITLEDLLCRSLADGENAAYNAVSKGIPYIKADEIPSYADAIAAGDKYQAKQFIQIPGVEDGMIGMEFGRNILIVSEKETSKSLFDNDRQERTLLLKRTGISIANGKIDDANAVRAFNIRYIIKCYDKDDHAETMLEDITARLDRIEGKLG